MSERVKFLRFPSIMNPEANGYLWENDRWDCRNTGLCMSASWYQTYGDRNVQHSGDMAVGPELWIDYLASLASHLANNPDDAQAIAYRWPSPLRKELLEFAADLRYIEGKPRWYCLSDCKVSASRSKQHDRRWEDVPSWADGSLENQMRILDKVREELLHRYSAAVDICDHSTRMSWRMAATYVGLAEEHYETRTMLVHNAFVAVGYWVDLYNAGLRAKGSTECLLHNLGNLMQSEAEKQAAVVA